MSPLLSTADFSDFESHVEQLLEHLFVGFRRHKSQHRWLSARKRPDFTLMAVADHRERLVVDAKFCKRVGLREVKQVQGYKGHPFFAKHAAIVMPSNCVVDKSAERLAEEKRVMLVRLAASKKPRYGIRTIWTVIPWVRLVGFRVATGRVKSLDHLVKSAEWITGPYWSRQ